MEHDKHDRRDSVGGLQNHHMSNGRGADGFEIHDYRAKPSIDGFVSVDHTEFGRAPRWSTPKTFRHRRWPIRAHCRALWTATRGSGDGFSVRVQDSGEKVAEESQVHTLRTLLPVVLASISLFTVASQAQDLDQGELRSWVLDVAQIISTTEPNGRTSDLSSVGRSLGDATIVMLGEGLHGGAEPLAFRNRLFAYLVEERDFDAIAIESGLVESRLVHDYVLDGSGNLDDAIELGLHSAFRNYPQNRELVQWLRRYNSDSAHEKKVAFFGFDIPGSPGNSTAPRGIDTGLDEALRYLQRVGPEYEIAFRQRLRTVWPSLHFDPSGTERSQYVDLTQAQRDLLTSIVADVIGLFEREQASFVRRSSTIDYQWAYRAALGARQVDTFLRGIPLDWEAGSDLGLWYGEIQQYRDRAMVDNMEWILSQLGPAPKVLVFGENGHVGKASRQSTYPIDYEYTPFAAYLTQRYGDRIIVIGHVFQGGTFAGCGGAPVQSLAPAPESTVSGVFAQPGLPLFVLDLRTAPDPVAQWLRRPGDLWNGFEGGSTVVANAFDLIFFSSTVTPACPSGR